MNAQRIDSNRLRRALFLDVAPHAEGRWTVTGGAEPHLVTRARTGSVRCDCLDALYRPQVRCKHNLAVALSRGERHVLTGLRELLGEAQ